MNISIVTFFPYPYRGGVSSHLDLLVRYLKLKGYTVDIISQKNLAPHRIFRAPIKMFSKLFGKMYITYLYNRMANNLAKVILKTKPSLIHCHDCFAAWACGRISFENYSNIVCTVHGPASKHAREHGKSEQSPDILWMEKIEREAWPLCHRIITVDTGQKNILLQQGASENIIKVIYNAVDIDEIDSCNPADKVLAYPYLLVPRRLTPKNGVEYAIRSLPLIHDNDIRLVIAGDGGLRQQLEKMTKSLGLESRVIFLGQLPREQVIGLMWHAAVVLIPSIFIAGFAEATSIAALEAMAAGKPVIASSVGGLVEIIDHDRNGILVPEKNPQLLAAAIENILTNPDLARRLGEEARQSVYDNFSPSNWIKRIEEVYFDALNSV